MATTSGDMPTFAVSDEADRSLPSIPFRLQGTYAPGKSGKNGEDSWTEDYHALPVVPLAATAAMTEAFFVDEATGRRQVNPGAVTGFLRDALPEDEARTFMQLVHDKDRLVKLEVLSDVVQYLTQRYTGRPTGPLSSSGTGGSSVASGVAGG